MKQYFIKIWDFLKKEIYGIPYWAIAILPLALLIYLIYWLLKPKGSKNSKPW
ncbi:hypothetical protein [uncultured Tenacibaculum sp.]|uniref:hypothetical protein n=1 Tax=uncultured Tenacibaculum sp. TaxID=174713 RepID=UPI002637B3CF|nr:hypothetical protein [uncultured Tenacibaculum sp.]